MSETDTWTYSPVEALRQLMQWGHTTTKMRQRIMDPDAGPVTREGDLYLFAMAARQALRFAELIERRATPEARPAMTEALAAFNTTSPQIKDVRDVLDHMDEYMTGQDSKMRRADLKAGTPADHDHGWFQVWTPTQMWVDEAQGTFLLRIQARPGKVLTLDVTRDGTAVSDLVDAIRQALPV